MVFGIKIGYTRGSIYQRDIGGNIMPDRQFLFSWVAVFLTTMIFGYLVFGLAMNDYYADPATAGGMAYFAEGEERLEWLMIANLVWAYLMVRIWRHGYEGTGIGEGVRFGLLLGTFYSTAEMVTASFAPVPINTMIVTIVVDIAMFVVAGIVLAKVYPSVAKG
jgi:hypothetical protein